MKLSIIIPVYNVEDYLSDCLNSVLNQNIDDYEIICVEDKSTDSSKRILEEYASKYMNIKIIYHSRNRGLSSARNTGISHAQGEYIQFVDSDDMIKPNVCGQLYEIAKENNADDVIFNLYFLNSDNECYREQKKYPTFPNMYTGKQILCKYQDFNISKPETVRHFLKKEFLLTYNLSFYEGIIHEDILFYFMVLMKAQRVVDINAEYYIYRQRHESICWGQKEDSASSLMVCLINICSYWMTNSFSSEENRYIYEFIKTVYISYLNRKCIQDSTKLLGQEKEQLIQKIIKLNVSKDISFKDFDIEKLKTNRKIIIYGAGAVAKTVLTYLNEKKISVLYIAVTDSTCNPTIVDGVPVKAIRELKEYTDAIVVIGTGQQFYEEITNTLNKYNFTEIIYPII